MSDSDNEIEYLKQFPEAVGEDAKRRPHPADEASDGTQANQRRSHLYAQLHQTIDRLETEGTSRGDLKILNRTLSELGHAFQVFQPYRRQRKVTVFGSARTPEGHPTYQQAVEYSNAIAKHGWMIITGAGHGIMEAGHKGAGIDLSMGLNIHLPFEQSSNEIIEGDHKLVTMKYFFTRKLMFVKECSAVTSLPGGFGTLDETAEVLTLLQTGKQTMLPVGLLDAPGGDFWQHFGQFVTKTLLADGMISPEDTSLFFITDNVQHAIQETLGFYRVYHSLRYVGDELVLRISQPLSESDLDGLNSDFSDILVNGTIQQVAALPAESNEPELASLPRLKMLFNRKSLGRLRQLINRVNATCPECTVLPTTN